MSLMALFAHLSKERRLRLLLREMSKVDDHQPYEEERIRC